MENLLKAYQAAAILNISEDKLNRLVRAGEIPYVAIGNRNRRYDPEELKKFVERMTKNV